MPITKKLRPENCYLECDEDFCGKRQYKKCNKILKKRLMELAKQLDNKQKK